MHFLNILLLVTELVAAMNVICVQFFFLQNVWLRNSEQLVGTGVPPPKHIAFLSLKE